LHCSSCHFHCGVAFALAAAGVEAIATSVTVCRFAAHCLQMPLAYKIFKHCVATYLHWAQVTADLDTSAYRGED